jgi:hypothetical protein
MDASTLEEYRGLIDHKFYLVELLPVLSSLLSPPSGTGRNSAANVIKFLTGSPAEDCRVSNIAPHNADIINGFKTGSAACRYLETLR